MILVDVNILVSAADRGNKHHAQARDWWRAMCDEGETIGLAWMAITGFLRLSTQPTVFQRPFTVREACDQVAEWMALPNVLLIQELDDHWPRLRHLLEAEGRGGNLVPDMHLATLADARDAAVASFDRDFGRFGNLPWIHPGRMPGR